MFPSSINLSETFHNDIFFTKNITAEQNFNNPKESFVTPPADRNYIKDVFDGEYDQKILSAFRCNHFDLRQLTSGVSYKQYNSIFHKLAKFIGLPDDDDTLAFLLYRMLMINKRGIRDQIENCECCRGSNHYITEPVNIGYVPESKKYPIEKFIIDNQDFKERSPPSELSSQLTMNSQSTSKGSTKSRITIKPPEVRKPLTIDEQRRALAGQEITMACPRCGEVGVTDVQYKIGCCSISTALGFMLFCCIPCAFIGLLSNCGKDVMHICRNCRYILGIVKKRPCGKTMIWNWDVDNAAMPERFSNSQIKNKMLASAEYNRASRQRFVL